MNEQNSKIFSPLPVCSPGLLERIILAIKREEELKETRKILFVAVGLFLISLSTIPFSFIFLATQWNTAGTSYFISTTFENLTVSVSQWQDFVLSIFESLPLLALILFSINSALAIFTIRLFLYKKGLLLKYLSR